MAVAHLNCSLSICLLHSCPPIHIACALSLSPCCLHCLYYFTALGCALSLCILCIFCLSNICHTIYTLSLAPSDVCITCTHCPSRLHFCLFCTYVFVLFMPTSLHSPHVFSTTLLTLPYYRLGAYHSAGTDHQVSPLAFCILLVPSSFWYSSNAPYLCVCYLFILNLPLLPSRIFSVALCSATLGVTTK